MRSDNRTHAVLLLEVEKTYNLYRSSAEEMLSALGWLPNPFYRSPLRTHRALAGISLSINHGERVALVGRNGAGKSTLLKLITSAAQASSGRVLVEGSVRSLSDLGIGFHPEFTGRENVRAALAYNNLTDLQLESAIEDIVEFCELADFIDMPLLTYSAGMLARLYFATATAIKPDILVIDEVMGAGDAYFAARSAARLRQLALSGCTLLLVSHSTQQVMEFCERCIWVEQGRIVADGPALSVVKAYESFVQHLAYSRSESGEVIQNESIVNDAVNKALAGSSFDGGEVTKNGFAEGGVSAWPSSGKLRIDEVRFENPNGVVGTLASEGEDWTIALKIRRVGSLSGNFRAIIVLFGPDGRWASRMVSPPLSFEGDQEGARTLRCRMPSLRLGSADYVVSVSLHEALDPWDVNCAERYDLLSRSFAFTVADTKKRKSKVHFPVRHPSKWATID